MLRKLLVDVCYSDSVDDRQLLRIHENSAERSTLTIILKWYTSHTGCLAVEYDNIPDYIKPGVAGCQNVHF